MRRVRLAALTALAFMSGTAQAAPAPGSFARAAYRTLLAKTCPNPLVMQLDWLPQAEHGGLFQLTMHPNIIGHRSGIFILDEVIRAAKAKGSVWFATHEEICRYCADEAGLGAPIPPVTNSRS